MKTVSKLRLTAQLRSLLIAVLSMAMLTSCGSDNEPTDDGLSPTGDFELVANTDSLQLIEGDNDGLTIPISLIRNDGHTNPVQLEILGLTEDDVSLVTSRFSTTILTPGADSSQVVLKLAIDDRPIAPQTREFTIRAEDGLGRDTIPLTIDVLPTSAPDVYLLIGQSNMIGFSGDGTRQAFAGGPDEPNSRIRQLNVSKNDGESIFNSDNDYTSIASNIIEPALVTAEDPLHIPLDPNNTGKDLEYIGLGLTFGKTALQDTTADIVLVPAAWSGTSFCRNSSGTQANWNAEEPTNSELGNTLLFDRAVTRANLALSESNGILRGILWHQGESDGNDRCAPLYEENMIKLIRALRTTIQPDLRGPELRQADSNIPFVLGTMSRGADERGDLSDYLPAKQMIDDIHRNLPNLVSSTTLSNHDDLIPANGFDCGNTSCIHFGPAALREMGRRYYAAMLRAIGQ
jgi:hypothetical protein